MSDWTAMRGWRRLAGKAMVASLVSVVAALGIRSAQVPEIVLVMMAIGSLGVFGVSVVMTLVCLFRAAAAEVGVGYALRHVILIVVFLPIACVSLFAVTSAVESDILKWQARDKSDT
jgi:predicted membrane protein